MASLSANEKERFLRALEEDRNFRYAIMGLLGFKEVLDRITKLEERFTRLEERFAKLEERQQRVEEELVNFRRTMAVIAHRFGVMTERSFREAMKYVVEDVLGVAEVSKWVYKDREGIVYGYPSEIEVDLVVKDKVHILVEVKSRVSKGDVAELYRIGKLYEKVEGIKPDLVILGGFVDTETKRLAEKLGVRIFPIVED